MQGWGGSCRDGVGHAGLGWVIQGWGGSCRGGVSHAGWGGSCRGVEGHTEVGWGKSCRGWVGHTWVWKISLNNLICHKLGILSFLLTNYCQLLSG